MANPAATLQVRVRAITHEADHVLSFELRPQHGQPLPAFTAGAHIDVHLAQGLVRSYSLCNDPAETHRYCIGVHRAPASRGGSRFMHDAVRPGDVLTIAAPRNHFPLAEPAPAAVFIAGGIGITPILAMLARARALGTPWTLYYAARSRAHAAFLEQLARVADRPGTRVVHHFDDEAGGARVDLEAIVRDLPAGAHLYCCGPAPMLQAYERATAALPPERVHKEYFAGEGQAASDGGYAVTLARSGRTLRVQAGQTLLDCLIAAGTDPMHSCRQGICGTCEVRVLEGVPDHRDLVLSAQEREANDRMMPCCSGARSERLVLDL